MTSDNVRLISGEDFITLVSERQMIAKSTLQLTLDMIKSYYFLETMVVNQRSCVKTDNLHMSLRILLPSSCLSPIDH